MSKINIVLHEPQIPQNTGNIARTCAATGASLHIIKPMGFKIDDAKLKRAGLDYWYALDLHYYDSFDEFFSKNKPAKFYAFTKKAPQAYTSPKYEGDVWLIFGKETTGLPEDFLLENYDSSVRIPMLEGLRSLNLSNSVAVAVYEVLRQRDFEGLMLENHILESNGE